MSYKYTPNPAIDKVHFSQTVENVILTDISGKILNQYKHTDQINIQDLPKGTYFLSTIHKNIPKNFIILKQ